MASLPLQRNSINKTYYLNKCSYFKKSGRGRVNRESLASCSSQTASVMTVAILATSGMERRDLLIHALLQLFQGQESIRGY